MTWRDGLNILAVVMVFLVLILWHGLRPREENVEVEYVSVVGVGYDIMPDMDSKYELGPDTYADNFDKIPGEDLDDVLEHLIRVENPGRDVDAVGDKHLFNKAYGVLQIRKPYLDDVNKIAGTSYTIKDMKNPVKARWAAKVYLNYYGEKYEDKTGNTPTLEVYARIHNGGPNGWKKASTNDYVRKINGGLK
jgi:hypothetical protein